MAGKQPHYCIFDAKMKTSPEIVRMIPNKISHRFHINECRRSIRYIIIIQLGTGLQEHIEIPFVIGTIHFLHIARNIAYSR